MIDLKRAFIERFGGKAEEVRIFSSPGRVNLIGEHVDYNGGLVLPAAIKYSTTIAIRKREDRLLVMEATDLPDKVIIDLDKIDEYKNLKWGNYQAGVAKELALDGIDLVGADVLYHDTVPHGSGLSSSAAIEVATALALTSLSGVPADMVKMALIAQRAERNYVGVACGIMDQFASAMGKKDCAVLLDCATLSYEHIPLRTEGYRIVIANTNKKRSLITSKYNERCEECAKALEALKSKLPEIKALANVSVDDFELYKGEIENDIIRKRAKHVIYECDRVKRSADALKKGDIELFCRLLNESGDSLRYLYEVTGVELDTLVDAARGVEGCVASRMTGAGFGGCTVSLVKEEEVDAFTKAVEKIYTEKIGYAPSFYITDASDGGREIK